MKPIELKIKGLNSFSEMQVIDFEYLTRDGLFGIVGQTGCGKTTVVDAITMAMYGEMPRYDGDAKRLRECVNTNADEMYISFKFQIREGSTLNTYTAERKYKKKNEKLNSVMARLVMGTEDVKILADSTKEVTKEVIRITGLNYDDFTRSVVLPQGKFSQFLLLANKERRDMLERIFDFSKYGEALVKRISSELNEKRNGVNSLLSNIAVLGDVSEETIQADKEKTTILEAGMKALKVREKEAVGETLRLTEVKNAAEEYENYAEERLALAQKEGHINELKTLVLFIEKAAGVKTVHIENENGKRNLDENSAAIKKSVEALNTLIDEEEGLKNVYRMLLLKKETEYPKLIERESLIKQAVENGAEKKKIAGEVSSLEAENEKILKDAEGYKKNLETQRLKREDAEKEIKAASDEKISLAVPSVTRQAVSKATVLQSKREELLQKFTEMKKMYAELNSVIEDNKAKLSCYINESSELEVKIAELEKRKTDNEKFAGESLMKQKSEDMMKLANLLEISRSKWEKLEKYKQEEKDLSERLKSAEDEDTENGGKLNATIEELKQVEDSLNLLKKELLLYEAVKILKDGEPCPICGSVEHPAPHSKSGTGESGLLEAEALYQKLTAEKERLQINKEKILANKRYILEMMSRCRENIKENHLEEDPNTILERYRVIEREYNTLTEENEAWAKSRADNEKLLSEYSEKYRKISVERALASERRQKDSDSFEKIKEELTVLHELIKDLRTELDSLAQTLGTSDFKQLAEKIDSGDNRREELEKKEELLRAGIVETARDIEKTTEALTTAEKRLQGIESITAEKKKRIEELTEKINSVTGGESAEKILKSIGKEIKSIVGEADESGRKLEEASRNRHETQIMLAALNEKQKTLESINAKTEENLKRLLAENGFADVEESAKFFDMIEDRERYEYEIRLFEEAYISAKARADAAYEKLSRLKIGQEYLKNEAFNLIRIKAVLSELASETESIKNEIESAAREVAVLSERITAKTEARKKYLAFCADKKKLEHEAGLLEDLSGLFKGNKFAEALSYRQLKYISLEATKRLNAITAGRYSLELQDLEFIIRDDFNGGIRRSPKTLSGGETFMVSLCLSLALSSKIQMKNSAPLEFFFLDEGFGTLDAEATETVISTLEKLRMEKLSVGVITHVEEIKNRLGRRLVVMPPVQGVRGSKVTLE